IWLCTRVFDLFHRVFGTWPVQGLFVPWPDFMFGRTFFQDTPILDAMGQIQNKNLVGYLDIYPTVDGPSSGPCTVFPRCSYSCLSFDPSRVVVQKGIHPGPFSVQPINNLFCKISHVTSPFPKPLDSRLSRPDKPVAAHPPLETFDHK